MAKQNSRLKAVSKETRKPITDSKKLIESLSYQGYTLGHIKRATGHIRELSLMLYEAQDGGCNCCDVARAVQDLMDTYANDINDCVESLEKLTKDAYAMTKSGAE